MTAGGADLIDVGGESTRPGAAPVGEAEEMAADIEANKLARLLPTMRAVEVLQFCS